MIFPLLPIVSLKSEHDEGFLTDHNRSELSVSYEDVGSYNRTAMGTLRGFSVAKKRTFSLSWERTPANQLATVDGGWSGAELLEFYSSLVGEIELSIYSREMSTAVNSPIETITVRMKEPSYDVVKRNWRMSNGVLTDMWNFSCSWEEI
jgi:hypothetical protein